MERPERTPKIDQPWQFHRTPWETEFLARFANVETVVRIACPFIKLRNIRLILASLPARPARILTVKVLTRLNAPDCQAHVHDLSALELLLANPLHDRCQIDVRVNNTLHAKCFIFGMEEVIITSSNLTFAAFHKNVEMALATTDPSIVALVTAYFDELFANAEPLTETLVRSIRTTVEAAPAPMRPLDEGPNARSAAGESAERQEAADSAQLDPTAIGAIDTVLARHLETSLDRNCVRLAVLDRPGHSDFCENAFYRDVIQRFAAAFGGTPLSEAEVATVFAHRSAYPHLKHARPDAQRAEHYENIGKRAMKILVAEALMRATVSPHPPDALVTKTNYICASDHLVRQLHDDGVLRLLLHGSTIADGHAAERARVRLFQRTVFRLIGFLAATRGWSDCRRLIMPFLDLQESFPFESYRDHNYKSELQRYAQECGHRAPEYRLVSKEGPDDDPVFCVEVVVGSRILSRGSGTPRKVAEMKAAFEAVKITRMQQTSVRPRAQRRVDRRLVEECERVGQPALQQVAGQAIPLSLACCVLLPEGSPRCEYADQREALAALGGLVRDCVAYQFFATGRSAAETTIHVSAFNKGEPVIRIVQTTPIWRWIQSVATVQQFAMAAAPRVVVQTLNALFGALYLTGGIDASSALASLLFRDRELEAQEDLLPAKSRLQQIIQKALGVPSSQSTRFVLDELHPHRQAHRAVYQARVLLAGREIGRAVAKSKRAAEEIACKAALASPLLSELLDMEREQQGREKQSQ